MIRQILRFPSVREFRHLAVKVARKLHRTLPGSCAKRVDLIQCLIVDFACIEPVLREIASEEKSAIEWVNELVNNPSKSRRASKCLCESVHDSNEAFRYGKAGEWIGWNGRNTNENALTLTHFQIHHFNQSGFHAMLKFFVHSVVLVLDHFHLNQIHDEHELNFMNFHLGSQTDSQFVKFTFNPPNLRSVDGSAFCGVNLCNGLITSKNQSLVFENNWRRRSARGHELVFWSTFSWTTLCGVFLCCGEKNSKDGPGGEEEAAKGDDGVRTYWGKRKQRGLKKHRGESGGESRDIRCRSPQLWKVDRRSLAMSWGYIFGCNRNPRLFARRHISWACFCHERDDFTHSWSKIFGVFKLRHWKKRTAPFQHR
jgi:hypothetical protein